MKVNLVKLVQQQQQEIRLEKLVKVELEWPILCNISCFCLIILHSYQSARVECFWAALARLAERTRLSSKLLHTTTTPTIYHSNYVELVCFKNLVARFANRQVSGSQNLLTRLKICLFNVCQRPVSSTIVAVVVIVANQTASFDSSTEFEFWIVVFAKLKANLTYSKQGKFTRIHISLFQCKLQKLSLLFKILIEKFNQHYKVKTEQQEKVTEIAESKHNFHQVSN